MTATTIRYKPVSKGFAVVTTTFLPSFAARYQRYSLFNYGTTRLEHEAVFDNERDAILMFDETEGDQP